MMRFLFLEKTIFGFIQNLILFLENVIKNESINIEIFIKIKKTLLSMISLSFSWITYCCDYYAFFTL